MAFSYLKNVVDNALEPKTDLITILRKNIGGYKPERSHEVVHASDVTKPDFCPRRVALLSLYGENPKDRYISTALQVTFDVGNLTSDLVREKWLGDRAIGNWYCAKCHSTVTFKSKPADNVPCKCGGSCDWRYMEVNFVCAESDISGSIDVIVDLGAPKLFIVELKIINTEDFDKIVAPLAEHRIRTNLYMRIVENSTHPFKSSINTNVAKVLYVSRGYGRKHPEYGEVLPFKEFDVYRDDDVLVPYVSKALAVKKFKDDGVLPNGICVSPLDTYAKSCQMCKKCFSGEA